MNEARADELARAKDNNQKTEPSTHTRGKQNCADNGKQEEMDIDKGEKAGTKEAEPSREDNDASDRPDLSNQTADNMLAITRALPQQQTPSRTIMHMTFQQTWPQTIHHNHPNIDLAHRTAIPIITVVPTLSTSTTQPPPPPT